jgi:hypothetical protein
MIEMDKISCSEIEVFNLYLMWVCSFVQMIVIALIMMLMQIMHTFELYVKSLEKK